MKFKHFNPFLVLCLFGVARLRPLLMLLFLTLPAVVQAQFTYKNENDTITITGYTGPDGAVIIPDTIDGLPVTRIGDSAFYFHPGLTSVTIPNSVISIGESAFDSCWSLTTVAIPNRVVSIGVVAFASCKALTSIAIPNSVTNIGYSAFAACSSLTNVTIGNGVTSIEAFGSCTNLTSITIGNSVNSIGDDAFINCQSLTSITIPNNVTNIGVEAFWACATLTNVYFQGNAPAFVGFYSFEYANNATVYYLPGTTGWGTTFSGRPTVLWNPLMETGDGSFGVRTNRFGFNISGTADIPIVVEASTTLANADWVPLQSLNLTNGAFYFSDPNWANYPARNYRIRSP